MSRSRVWRSHHPRRANGSARTCGLALVTIGIQAPAGTPVHSVEAGKVRLVGQFGTYGLTVLLEHGSHSLDEAASVGAGTAAAGLTGATVAASAAAVFLLVAGAPVTVPALAGTAIVAGLAASFGYLTSRAMQ